MTVDPVHALTHRLDMPDASEIRREEPGACPICGMALEPLAPPADASANAELNDMTRRFWPAMV